MLISDSHEFLFVHIRKAAGTSVRSHLEPNCLQRPAGLLPKILSRSGLEKNYRHFVFRKHAALAVAEAKMPADSFAGHFKFAFVRNPWDRLVSEFEYIRGQESHSRNKRLSKMTEIGEFIEFQRRRRDAFQWHMLCDRSGRMAMDFVGRFENLQADFDTVCGKIGLETTPLAKINVNAHRDYREYFDARSRALVAKYWYKEIEYFGYEFGN